MESYEITAEVRTSKGKGPARRLRRSGRIPAVLYGGSEGATPLQMKPERIELLRRQPLGWNTPLTLDVDGMSGKQLVMVKGLQRHPVSRRLLHVDFWRIDENQPLEIAIRVETVGHSLALELGGSIHLMRHKLDVRCKPADIPEVITIDISDLEIGDKLYVDEAPVPDSVEVVYEERFPLLTILAKGLEVEEEEEEDEEAEEEQEGEEEDE